MNEIDRWLAECEQGIDRTKHICQVCGIEFVSKDNRDIACCSSKCRVDRYNVRKGFNLGRGAWLSLREYILERDNYTCQDCGVFHMDKGLEAHHVVPLRQRGANEPDNLITLCSTCHLKRHGS